MVDAMFAEAASSLVSGFAAIRRPCRLTQRRNQCNWYFETGFVLHHSASRYCIPIRWSVSSIQLRVRSPMQYSRRVNILRSLTARRAQRAR
jgi:hypothetical protein